VTDDLREAFERAQAEVNNLKSRPSDTELLKLYGLYKQATSGDVSGARPGMLDIKRRAKYDAWAKVAGLDGDDAMSGYIRTVETLKARYGMKG
jgi:acyl-CoA-binding protein